MEANANINVKNVSDERLGIIANHALESGRFSLADECVDEAVSRGVSLL